MSEEKPSHVAEGIVRMAPRQDCVEAEIWGRVPKHFCSIEGPQEHSGLHHSITEERSKSEEKGLGQGGDKDPDGHSDRVLEFLCGDGRTFQDNHLCSTPPIRPLW